MNIDLNTEIFKKALQGLQENIKMELKKFFEISQYYGIYNVYSVLSLVYVFV